MTEALFIGVTLAAGMACPLHMWWARRCGPTAVWCPRRASATGDAADLDTLRERQARLAARIAELEPRRTEMARGYRSYDPG